MGYVGFWASVRTHVRRTMLRKRRLIDLDTHGEVFAWVLGLSGDRALLAGRWIGIDATMEAGAVMGSIVRRDLGESNEESLLRLSQTSGIETPPLEDLARLDRKHREADLEPGLETFLRPKTHAPAG